MYPFLHISVRNLEFPYDAPTTQYLALRLIFSYNKLSFSISHHLKFDGLVKSITDGARRKYPWGTK
jgi:hypothetical protein